MVLNYLKNSQNLEISFPDLENVWKNKDKDWKRV